MIKLIKNIFNTSYKYGFKTKIKLNKFYTGINEYIIKLISQKKYESNFILNFRLNAYKKWKIINFPLWSNLKFFPLNYNSIIYFSSPKQKYKLKVFSKINTKLKYTFKKLGITLKNKKNTSKIAIDLIFDSISIVTTYKNKLAKLGIIFCSISEAIKLYPLLIKKFLGLVISSGDNFFSALNSAIFTDGSFCYIPQNLKCPLELSTYFRINKKNSGQFERTLIIVEKNSLVNYIEGCTATKYNSIQLHTAIVELISFSNAQIKYSTIQNWYSGNKVGFGGIYNFVTKRGLALGKDSIILWIQIEAGSAITWKYPSCILLGLNSRGEFYSITLTNFYQQADTGTKMIHIGKNTRSKILTKGISTGYSNNTYRGLIKVASNALYSKNYSQCDSFLLGLSSYNCTYPYLDISNSKSLIEHEAKISKINEEQLFYLLQRGINKEIAINLILNGFCKEIFLLLPFEFINDINKLLELKL